MYVKTDLETFACTQTQTHTHTLAHTQHTFTEETYCDSDDDDDDDDDENNDDLFELTI